MDCEYRAQLDAFHDGELTEPAAEELRRHLQTCPKCSAELAEIRELARSFGQMRGQEMSKAALARAHQTAEEFVSEQRSPILRIVGVLTALAASVLIVTAAWLADTSDTNLPIPMVAINTNPPPEWERVAMTLQAPPLPGEFPEDSAPLMLASAPLPDAPLAGWMLRNLNR